ncbi:hypothetical protein [Aeromonas veronii]|uniref:hypothetical protein n=1 Tax=Aeromonas veronii TaxID=654 RepID=UPI003BA30F2A
MHVILLTSLFGEKRGNVGDKLPVASQEEADELISKGIARPDTEAELKRQLAEYQAREQRQQEADALVAAQAKAAEDEAAAQAKAAEADPKQVKQAKAKPEKA